MLSLKCGKCEKYIDFSDYVYGGCKTCYINFISNLTKSGNEKIDDIIQEMQLKINNINDIVFEWIPYNQFDNIEKISKGDFATVCSAIWKDGPLCYNFICDDTRESDKKVVLKCVHDSQNVTDE